MDTLIANERASIGECVVSPLDAQGSSLKKGTSELHIVGLPVQCLVLFSDLHMLRMRHGQGTLSEHAILAVYPLSNLKCFNQKKKHSEAKGNGY